MKLLMVTSRNIDKSGGENALIMGRHMALYQEYGIETDIIFFHKNTEENSSNIYLGMQFIKCDRENVYNKIEQLLSTGRYQGIVSSGFYDKKFTEFIQLKKKEYNFIYIVDIHATIKEIYEYCIPDFYHIIGTRYLYLKKKIRFIETLKTVDYAFVVSDEEITEVDRFLPKNKIKFLPVRCGCYHSIDVKEYFIKRTKQREILGIDADTIAFVYSGSKDRWQKFEETKKVFKSIKDSGVKCKFAFYMDLDENSKQEIYDDLGKESVTVRWVTPEIMKNELPAFDVGMLLRDNTWTNRVAFPNKYSDYIVSGLHLCLSQAIVDPYKITKEYGLKILDTSRLIESAKEIQRDRENNLDNYVILCQKIVENELLYNVQVRKQCKELAEHMIMIRGV